MTSKDVFEELRSPQVPPRAWFPCFDGLRAIAATCVVVFHTGFSSGYAFRSGLGETLARGDIGVAIFFLISGFLLYRPFVRARLQSSPGLALRPYFRRRLLRILPAYWVALTFLAFVVEAEDVTGVRGADALAFYGLVQIYVPGLALQGIGQAWSIATELSFYVFLPLWALLLRQGRPRDPQRQLRTELLAVGGLYAFSVLFRIVVHNVWPDHTEVAFWLPATADLFALGMGLAVVSSWLELHGREPSALRWPWFATASWLAAASSFWLVDVALGIGLYPFVGISFTEDLIRQALYGLTAFFLLLPAVFGPQDRGRVRWFLRSRVVAFVGLVSYGLYLWHPWVTSRIYEWTDATVGPDAQLRLPSGRTLDFWLVLAATMVLGVAVAAVSYVVAERPFLSLKRRARPRGAASTAGR